MTLLYSKTLRLISCGASSILSNRVNEMKQDPILRAKLAIGMVLNYYGESTWLNDLSYIFSVVI